MFIYITMSVLETMDNDEKQMMVTKRNGNLEEVSFDKILTRVKKLCMNIEPKISIQYAQLVIKVIDQLYDNITTAAIDELLAQQCASQCTKQLNYGILASRIVISNHHKNTTNSFYQAMKDLYLFEDVNGKHTPLIDSNMWNFVDENKDVIDEMIDYNRDYLIDFFGFKTLERAYLMRVNKRIVERPQHMWMRVAIGIHGSDIKSIKTTYDLMSQKYFTHATPTLFNAGTPRPQLSSCYLVAMESDSIDGIYNTLKECANISKWAGGIGMHIHNVRPTGSQIRGTNGTSNGIVPMLRVFNSTARYVDQGGGKRNGSFAVYVEPWHADIYEFLELKKNHGDEEQRARDLFYALWIPSLFMEKVQNNETWHLFCPDRTPHLADVYGDEFNKLYNKYVSEGRFIKEVRARDLWLRILDSQMETGTPYLLFKDHANEKSNQKNLGTIKSSNLCTEIIEYSDEKQTAVCNLASIGLSKFVNEDKTFNYEKLHDVTKIVTRNLDKIIDRNFYPTPKTRVSNYLHRPIGIGVQGLADVYAVMDIPFYSDEAKVINKMIFETIYHASVECSCEIAMERSQRMVELSKVNNVFSSVKVDTYNVDRDYNEQLSDELGLNDLLPVYAELEGIRNGSNKHPGAYSSFTGSPLSEGLFQFDLWDVKPSDRYDWDLLRTNVMKYGVRNSLLVAPMPTASTSQILGNNECFEPFTSNIYSRRTIAGDFVIVNKHLLKELEELGVWSEELKNNIIANNGSIQQIQGLPQHIKDKYKIVWEMPMKHLIDMAADRGAFICQSQSMNLWLKEPNYKSLTSMHFYSWKKGLKTGIYYLRRKAEHQPQQFTIEVCETCSA